MRPPPIDATRTVVFRIGDGGSYHVNPRCLGNWRDAQPVRLSDVPKDVPRCGRCIRYGVPRFAHSYLVDEAKPWNGNPTP